MADGVVNACDVRSLKSGTFMLFYLDCTGKLLVILRKCRSRQHRSIYDEVLVAVSLTRAQKDALDMAYGKVLHKCASVQIPSICNTVNTPRESIREAN